MAKITRFGVLKTSTLIGIYSFFVMLVFEIIALSLAKLVFSLLSSSLGVLGLLSMSNFGIVSFIVYPIVSGVGSFILALILIPILNLTLKIIKGIDLDIELSGQKY